MIELTEESLARISETDAFKDMYGENQVFVPPPEAVAELKRFFLQSNPSLKGRRRFLEPVINVPLKPLVAA